MKPKRKVYEPKKFKDFRECLNNTVDLYPKSVAFKIKEQEGKNVTYKEITYSEF